MLQSKVLVFGFICTALGVQAHGASAATLLSDLISGGGSLSVGDLSFSGFQAAAPNTVDPTTVEVSTFVEASGLAGITFSAPLTIGTGGGSKELVSDILFSVSETNPGFVLHDLTQTFTTSVSGSGIAAFDFSRAGAAVNTLSTLAGNCVNGDAVGCSQIVGPTDTGLLGDVGQSEVEREVQLVRSRGGAGTGMLTSWDLVFGEAAAPSAAPEPAAWCLMVAGFAGLGLALRRRPGCGPLAVRPA
ncbi:MAG TPA: PEP-CTERM sorting domain-containing protein [Caulobacteraceae bacterium]